MTTLWTTLAVILVTALFMVWHVRRARTTSAPPVVRSRCPRCGASIASDAASCASCGVPLQAYQLVLAPIATAAAETGGAQHALVRADVCVGCGACVSVCPEPGAIRLEGKLAVVDLDLCKGHGECVQACPVNGIALTTGAAVQRVQVPLLDVHFQSNVPGLYVVGELGGRGLIKNAINEGRIAAEHIARATRSTVPPQSVETPAAAPKEAASHSEAEDPMAAFFEHRLPELLGRAQPAEIFDVIVVGSGPAGLSAGLEAHRAGLRYLVLEQGDLSETIHRYPRHKVLLAEPVKMPLYGDLWIADASKESLLAVWRNVIERTGLAVRTGVRVEEVTATASGFEVRTAGERFAARRVVLALGRRGKPRRLEVPGEELSKVFYDIVEMEAFAGNHVLVVGGGDSAVESAVGLANQAGTHVTLSYRGEDFARVKERNRLHLEAERSRGRLSVITRSQVREIRPDSVLLDAAGETLTLPNQYVIIRAGGEPPYAFLERLGVRIVTKEVALDDPAAAGGDREAMRA